MLSPGALLHQINNHWHKRHNPIDPSPAVIFEDGFESGDFSAWTGTGGTPSVTPGDTHHGTYKAEMSEGDFCYKSFTPQVHLFLRAYVKIISISSDQYRCILAIRDLVTGSWSALVYVRDSAGTLQWGLRYNNLAGYAWSTQQTPVTNVWYAVELEVKSDNVGNTGENRVYVDDSELTDITQTGLTTTEADSGYAYLGPFDGTATIALHFDCAVVADTYIGPEVPPPVAGAKAMFGGLYLVYPD